MIDRMTLGRVPEKPHTVLRLRDGEGIEWNGDRIAYEHCFTRGGFDDAYSIFYHRHSPASEHPSRPADVAWRVPEAEALHPLRRAHFLSGDVPSGGDWLASRVPLLVNRDLTISVARPDRDAPYFVANGDGDEMLFFFKGGAVLETPFGVQEVAELDYLWIPRALPYRLTFQGKGPGKGPHHVLVAEAKNGWQVPRQFRNPSGQLTFDAPYSHRDFGRPERLVDVRADAQGTARGPWSVLTKRDEAITERRLEHHPCEVVGWDGVAYPVSFPILRYQPKTGKVHLPPTIHVTWSTRGAVLCSFVPRKVDYGPDAVPCPYPHSSVDCDEFLFYVRGHFTSRKGVGPGSVSLHPAGLPHAPQPGSYQASIGATETDELAVMIDTFAPMRPTRWALAVEDAGYMASWSPERFAAADGAPSRGRGAQAPTIVSQ